MKDSGSRTALPGGALKEMDGKPRMSLIPGTALRRQATLYTKGAEKYKVDGKPGDWNWAKGIPFSVCMDSIARHWCDYQMGDRSEDHLAAITFWSNAMMHFEETGRTDLMDLPRHPFVWESLNTPQQELERRAGGQRIPDCPSCLYPGCGGSQVRRFGEVATCNGCQGEHIFDHDSRKWFIPETKKI